MTTEFRFHTPSHAHIEAAARLGLLWEGDDIWQYEFRLIGGNLQVQWNDPNIGWTEGRTDNASSYRPIYPNNTLVDWSVLDAEVARVAGAAGAAAAQPQGFRADLWQRIASLDLRAPSLADIRSLDEQVICCVNSTVSLRFTAWPQTTSNVQRTDILARWAVYQELKPLYDLVDGATGEVAMPRDVIRAWWDRAPPTDTGNDHCPWLLRRERLGLVAEGPYRIHAGRAVGAALSNTLLDFATVLDAIAEARVRARQGQAETVVPSRHVHNWIYNGLGGGHRGEYIHNCACGERDWFAEPMSAPLPRERVVQPQTASVQRAQPVPVGTLMVQNPDGTVSPAQPGQQPIGRLIESEQGNPGLHDSLKTEPLPRFTADELDDVDHSRTTKLDQTTLRRGRLPTVEQIAKYREVRAKRTGGTVADALKESRIDCEVAQYVLERWAGGLGDGEVLICITNVHYSLNSLEVRWGKMVDVLPTTLIVALLEKQKVTTLDTTEPPDTAAQQARQQAEEWRQRLAQVQAQIAAERATTQPQIEAEPSRFDLIEPDPQADPTASIRAWEARQAAAKVKARPQPSRQERGAEVAPKRKPAIDLVNAQADGLTCRDLALVIAGRLAHGTLMELVHIGDWLLVDDDRQPGRYVLFRSSRGQWVFVRYLRILTPLGGSS